MKLRDLDCGNFTSANRLELLQDGMASKLTIGFLGAGKMATALAKGIVRAGLVTPKQIFGSDPIPAARAAFSRETGARIVTENAKVLESASVLVLATKPDQTTAVLEEFRERFTPRHLLISIAAGVPLAKLEGALPTKARVIRVMPNTPALVGQSATGFALGKSATKADGDLAQRLFSAVGVAFPLKE